MLGPELTFYTIIFSILAIDYVAGDPRWLPHPIRFIGWLCEIFENLARRLGPWISLKIKGTIAFGLVIFTTVAALVLILHLLNSLLPWGAMIGTLLTLFFCFASGDLVTHSRRVAKALTADDIDSARSAVSLLVGRDTGSLDSSGVARACVESVSENMVDGITAPLFWAFIGSLVSVSTGFEFLPGAALFALAYKAINTMDSMYGYKNERYLEFGWFAARFDDWCNLVPARLSGFSLIAVAPLMGFDRTRAAAVYFRDRRRHPSPNSAHSEAATAGALGIQLGGEASYFGKTSSKPLIGAGLNKAGPEHIGQANRLIIGGSILFFSGCCLLHFILLMLIR